MNENDSICAVVESCYGIGSSCDVEIEFNQKRFLVTLYPGVPANNTVESTLLQKLDDALKSGNKDEEDEIMEEIADVVCLAGFPHFEQLAPPSSDGCLPTDLLTVLRPQKFYFKLLTVEGEPALLREEDPEPDGRIHPVQIGSSTLRKFEMRHVQVVQKLRGAHITKVVVDGQVRCCKISNSMTQVAVQREFDCLSKIMAAANGNPIRVPKLTGLVRAATDGTEPRVVGIIEEFIAPHPHYSTLRRVKPQSIARAQRLKWAAQVRETIEGLHRIGVVWGDGKADNVLIDANDDAWLIDFGGSWTKGWVEEGLAGTVQGDLQAIEKIDDFLELKKE